MPTDLKIKTKTEKDKPEERKAEVVDVAKNIEQKKDIAQTKDDNQAKDQIAKDDHAKKEEKKSKQVPGADSVIEFVNVSKIYPGHLTAAEDVSFSVKMGEFVSLVGPSGAGKSTLIRLLTCEESPTGGEIFVAGRDVTKLKPKELPIYRRKVGVIFQDFKLLPKKTVFENIAFALEVAGAPNDDICDKVPKIIEIVGLTKRDRALVEELSGGEKQRVSIARALVHKPKILIADEPTGNLDPVTTWEIIELLFKINRHGTVVLLATHDKEVVDALQRRVITMRDGKIIADNLHGKYIL